MAQPENPTKSKGLWSKIRSGGDKELAPSTQTLAKVLEIIGETSFDLKDSDASSIQEQYRAWIAHLLEGKSSPNVMIEVKSFLTGERDWPGLIDFFSGHRQDEVSFVQENIDNLRDYLWKIIKQLSTNLAEDRSTDSQIGNNLHRLESIIETDSIEQIKNEVLNIVEGMGDILKKRDARQQDLLLELGSQLRYMRNEVESARKKMAIDPLTGLYNRSAFDEQLEKIIDLNMISGEPASLMMIDLDHFKNINDTHGHPAGDVVLKQVAEICIQTFPRKTDFVARYGGEEIAIILQQDNLGVASKLGNRLIEKIRGTTIQHDGKDLQVTLSIGASELIPTEDRPETWIERADKALYRAKNNGRDCMETL